MFLCSVKKPPGQRPQGGEKTQAIIPTNDSSCQEKR